jgi:hypothetical protein
VDKVSSAHVYLRLKKGETIHTISEALLEDCAQLVKAHSIQGACSISSDLSLSLSLSMGEEPKTEHGVPCPTRLFSSHIAACCGGWNLFSLPPPL